MRVNIARVLQGSLQSPPNKRAQLHMTPANSNDQQIVVNKGTIRPEANFNAEDSAIQLHDAFQGVGSDATTIISVLTRHSNHQRQAIKRHYKILYERNLETDILTDLGGHFKDVALALLQEPNEYIAENLHVTIKQVRPEESTLIEWLCCRSNIKIQHVKEAYHRKYRHEVDVVIRNELDKDLQRLMRSLVATNRDENKDLDLDKVHKEAQMLALAGVGVKYETDDPVIFALLNRRSYAHLRTMFEEYHKMSGRNINTSIEAEFKSGLRDALLALVKAVKNPTVFFAHQLHDALKEPNIKDYKVIRILVSRSEVDLADIKDTYLHLYGTKLSNTICDCTEGDYRNILLGLLGIMTN